ncbi:microtubule motor protein [Aureococcus anophagefferens]|uniref:Microtubule motor protein n=1 Tax=Aureococcus anophagefferens TaxID=44056 RepID=A0ABR1FQX3_AURAN
MSPAASGTTSTATTRAFEEAAAARLVVPVERRRGAARAAAASPFEEAAAARLVVPVERRRGAAHRDDDRRHDGVLADYLADAPRNARRAAQEADWDLKGAEDARQLLYEREVAWKYGALTARAINAYWRTGTGKTHTLREALDRLVDRHAGPVEVLAPDGRALTLVDLAGSERKWETMGMRGSAQNRESADINLSLMALKDCFRATHDGGRVPYRSSSLTRVLRTCFFDAEAVHLVATLSPSAGDLIHSVYSVATACLMAPGLGAATRSTVATERLAAELSAGTGDPALEHPARWSADTTRAWLLTAERGKFNHVVLPAGTTAGDLLSVDAAGLGALFAGQGRAARDGHEGAMWVVGADTDAALAREITNALKREACKWRLE